MDYQEEYIKNNPDLGSKDVASKVKSIKEIINQNKIIPNSILDIGCGSGAILLSLLSDYKIDKSCGIDISEIMINTAIKKDEQKLSSWIRSGIFDADFRSFDLVLAIDIIEHIKDDDALLKKLVNWGNLFVVKVPIEDNYVVNIVKYLSFGIIDSSKSTEEKYGHIHHYSEKAFTELVKNSGYEILQKNYMHLPKRHVKFWEIIRLLMMPVWIISQKAYIRLNGGFLVLLLRPESR